MDSMGLYNLEMGKIEKLRSPPLTEAVFEMHWGLVSNDETPLPFQQDPGLILCAESFFKHIKKRGYKHRVQLNKFHEITKGSVLYRYYLTDADLFPIYQLGPGIFAANLGSDYDWRTFKKHILYGVQKIFESYPDMKEFPFKPTDLQIRYNNLFEYEKISEDMEGFFEKSLNLNLQLPNIVKEISNLSDLEAIHFRYQFPTKIDKSTFFDVDIGNASFEDRKVVKQISRVRGNAGNWKNASGRDNFLVKLDGWLENAHNITSPFFKKVVREGLFKSFGPLERV